MTTYFVFSDEAGQYGCNPSAKFCSSYPYHVRSAVLLDVESWLSLKAEFFRLKTQYDLPEDKEIKWSYLWSLRKRQSLDEPVPANAPYRFLSDYPIGRLEAFISDSCALLVRCPYCRVVLTITVNSPALSIPRPSLYKMHLQELMQRIEMEIQSCPENLAILFFDSTDAGIEKLLRDSYHSIYSAGDFITTYAHIKDSISFELSHHSFGIQMADYTAGAFYGFLREFEFSRDLFGECIYGLLRKQDSSGEVLGYGIREVPRSDLDRSFLETRLSDFLPAVD